MITKADYEALIKELEALENDACAYLADTNIDHENVNAECKCGGEILPADPEFWSHMYSAACYAAGFRAKDAGLDINALIGRDIY